MTQAVDRKLGQQRTDMDRPVSSSFQSPSRRVLSPLLDAATHRSSGAAPTTKSRKAQPSSGNVRTTVKAESNGRNGLRELSKTALTVREMDSYFMRHPSSPAAVRRPHLYLAGATFVALLGPNVEEGIVGLGMTIEAAFRAFDFQYLKMLRPGDAKLQMAEPVSLDRASGQ